jgi:hypothetical protein
LEVPSLLLGEVKNDFNDVCKNGVMPLIFHEKMRIIEAGWGRVMLSAVEPAAGSFIVRETFRRFAGGGVISRSVMSPGGV